MFDQLSDKVLAQGGLAVAVVVLLALLGAASFAIKHLFDELLKSQKQTLDLANRAVAAIEMSRQALDVMTRAVEANGVVSKGQQLAVEALKDSVEAFGRLVTDVVVRGLK